MSTFTIARVDRHTTHGAHVATVTVAIGAGSFAFKVLETNGRGWVKGGISMGEPLKSRLRAAVLAAASYGVHGGDA